MKRLPLFLLKIALVCLLAMAVGIAVLYGYISTHEKEIIEQVETAYHDNFFGHIEVREVNLDWQKQFPFCSAVLKDVRVKDSNWREHPQSGIQIDYAYVRFKILPLLIGKVHIQKIILHNAYLHLFKRKLLDTAKAGQKSKARFPAQDQNSQNTL